MGIKSKSVVREYKVSVHVRKRSNEFGTKDGLYEPSESFGTGIVVDGTSYNGGWGGVKGNHSSKSLSYTKKGLKMDSSKNQRLMSSPETEWMGPFLK